jgi:lipopolysaccharide transport system ATP-binding protein
MTEAAIRIAGLGKQYHLGAARANYSTLRDQLKDLASSSLRALVRRGRRQEARPSFWALKDVSFEVNQGDVVGIIGRNGAGKSTLLKILSRITEPTEGSADIRGRVGSLLEVGTGFHPELTGRENVFLNGAILGMTRAEIKRRFDEIVAFAEVEKFIDTPVKHYSSGMYMRLAFAVAAHLEPEILIVDEVLAVGDAEFQAKCLGKMGQAAKSGRTVLFVSHNIASVQSLCNRCILLAGGRIRKQGRTDEVIAEYLRSSNNPPADLSVVTNRSGTGVLQLVGFWCEDADGRRIDQMSSGQDVTLVFKYRAAQAACPERVSVGFSIHSVLGDVLSIQYSDYSGVVFDGLRSEGEVRFRIPEFPLNQGVYKVGARLLAKGIEADWPKDFVGQLNVDTGNYRGLHFNQHGGGGPLLIAGSWAAAPAASPEPLTNLAERQTH